MEFGSAAMVTFWKGKSIQLSTWPTTEATGLWTPTTSSQCIRSQVVKGEYWDQKMRWEDERKNFDSILRKASFIREFSEDELLSQNIRFFFPDGCRKKEDLQAEASRQQPVYVEAPTTTVRTIPQRRAPLTTTTEAPQAKCPLPACVCTCSFEDNEL